jgi:hypothetical protein
MEINDDTDDLRENENDQLTSSLNWAIQVCAIFYSEKQVMSRPFHQYGVECIFTALNINIMC